MNSQISQVVYLQEAPRHNNQGRPLDTVLRAALVAVETNQDEIQCSHIFLYDIMKCLFLCVCVCVCVPTLLGPIIFFFTFFLGLGSAASSLSPPALDSMET